MCGTATAGYLKNETVNLDYFRVSVVQSTLGFHATVLL